jgi:hypothetical protein
MELAFKVDGLVLSNGIDLFAKMVDEFCKTRLISKKPALRPSLSRSGFFIVYNPAELSSRSSK